MREWFGTRSTMTTDSVYYRYQSFLPDLGREIFHTTGTFLLSDAGAAALKHPSSAYIFAIMGLLVSQSDSRPKYGSPLQRLICVELVTETGNGSIEPDAC
jgi:hypothetical protein